MPGKRHHGDVARCLARLPGSRTWIRSFSMHLKSLPGFQNGRATLDDGLINEMVIGLWHLAALRSTSNALPVWIRPGGRV